MPHCKHQQIPTDVIPEAFYEGEHPEVFDFKAWAFVDANLEPENPTGGYCCFACGDFHAYVEGEPPECVSTCKYCGESDLFISDRGLCDDCEARNVPDY